MINFERGLDPKDAMRIGVESQIKKWLLEENPNHPQDFEVNGNVVTIKSGVIIIKNRVIPDLPDSEIEFKKEGGELIIWFVHKTFISRNTANLRLTSTSAELIEIIM